MVTAPEFNEQSWNFSESTAPMQTYSGSDGTVQTTQYQYEMNDFSGASQTDNFLQESVQSGQQDSLTANQVVDVSRNIQRPEIDSQSYVGANTQSFQSQGQFVNLRDYPINQDDNPIVTNKQSNEQVTYKQEVAIRYLQPPTPPPPGPIVVREVRPPGPPPAPPVIVKQRPPTARTPPPLVLREAPPPAPQKLSAKYVTKKLPALPPPPRRIIIERLPPQPPKPRPIIIEKWLPYKQKCPRRVVFQKTMDEKVTEQHHSPTIRNVNHNYPAWPKPQVRVRYLRAPEIETTGGASGRQEGFTNVTTYRTDDSSAMQNMQGGTFDLNSQLSPRHYEKNSAGFSTLDQGNIEEVTRRFGRKPDAVRVSYETVDDQLSPGGLTYGDSVSNVFGKNVGQYVWSMVSEEQTRGQGLQGLLMKAKDPNLNWESITENGIKQLISSKSSPASSSVGTGGVSHFTTFDQSN